MIPTAVTGSITHLLQGTMLIPYVIPLGAGCAVGDMIPSINYSFSSFITFMLGAFMGAKVTRFVDEEFLKRLFFGTMLVLGARTFIKAI